MPELGDFSAEEFAPDYQGMYSAGKIDLYQLGHLRVVSII